MPDITTKKVAYSVANSSQEYATDFLAALARLKEATGARTDTELAHSIGLKQSSISGAKTKQEIPPAWIIEIAKKFNVSTDWLLFGIGEKALGAPRIASAEAQNQDIVPDGEPQWMSPEAAPAMGYTLVPKVQARLSAGTGSLETEGKVIGYYAFKTDFLLRKGRAGKMVLMDVLGDSMEPEIRDGDTVLIDESQNEILAGGLFAVGIEQEVYVKYLHRIPGKLILKSKNPEYEPIEVDMDGDVADRVRIVGRVVWSCREYVR
jgi:phage repressor protein C with HTH and peptisase S24 domain